MYITWDIFLSILVRNRHFLPLCSPISCFSFIVSHSTHLVKPIMSTTHSLPPLEPRLWINNEFVSAKSGKTLLVTNPYNETPIGSIEVAGPEDVDLAVAAAEAAFKTGSPWSKFSGVQRQTCLLKLADLIEARTAELAKYESLSVGTPYLLVSYGMIPAVVKILRSFAGWSDKIPGNSFGDEGDGFYKVSWSIVLSCVGKGMRVLFNMLSVSLPGLKTIE